MISVNSLASAAENDEPSELQPGLVRALGRAVRADIRSASAIQVLALAVLIAWLAFEWGPGNEIAVPSTMMALLERLDGLLALAIMPAAGFGLGFALQLVSGLIAAVGFSMLDNTARAAWLALRRWRRSGDPGDYLSMGWPARWGVSFLIGTTAVVLIQLFTTGEARVVRQVRPILISATLVAGTISGLALLVTIGVVIARRYPAAQPTVDRGVAVLANPLTWIVLLSVWLVVQQLVRLLRPSA